MTMAETCATISQDGVQCYERGQELARIACAHEHVTDVWLCTAHLKRDDMLCSSCRDHPDEPHKCVMVIRRFTLAPRPDPSPNDGWWRDRPLSRHR